MPVSAAPMHAPAIAASLMGVSRMRSSPNCSMRPALTPNAPPYTPTSSPSRNTRSSCSIAWRMASRMASAYVSSRVAVVVSSIYTVHDVGYVGFRAVFCVGDGVLDLLVGGVAHRIELVLGEYSGLHEPLTEAGDGVLRLPRLHLVAGAVGLPVALGVALPAIGHGLEQRRPLARARPLDRPRHRIIGGEGVVAVEGEALDAVGAGALADALDVEGPLHRHRHGVLVVLAVVDDRQVPDGSHVQRLVERALVGRTVAEHHNADLVGTAQLDAQADAYGDGDAAADNAVRAEVVALDVRNVHRAAAPPAEARLLAHELGHRRLDVVAAPPGDNVPVAAVVVEQVVIAGTQRVGRAHRRGFLPDAQVHRAVNLAEGVQLLGLLLERADGPHDLQHLARPLLADLGKQGFRPFRLYCGDRFRHWPQSFSMMRCVKRSSCAPASSAG